MLITESHEDVSTETGSMRSLKDRLGALELTKYPQVSSFIIPQYRVILKLAFPVSSSSQRYTK